MRSRAGDNTLRRAAPRRRKSLRGAESVPSMCANQPLFRGKPVQSLRTAEPLRRGKPVQSLRTA